MKKQETFDTVLAHSRAQGCQAYDEEAKQCAYRTDSGLMCFVGVLIPDDEYDIILEGKGVGSLVIDSLLKSLGHDLELCGVLQSIHDNHLVDAWGVEFQRAAEQFKLQYTPPVEN